MIQTIQGESNRYVILKFNYDKTKFLSIPWYEQAGTDEIIRFERKDTTARIDYYFANKAQLRLQLNNFTSQSMTDSFYIMSVYHDVGYNKDLETQPQFFNKIKYRWSAKRTV